LETNFLSTLFFPFFEDPKEMRIASEGDRSSKAVATFASRTFLLFSSTNQEYIPDWLNCQGVFFEAAGISFFFRQTYPFSKTILKLTGIYRQ
jgi:hypothetical protein